MARLIDADALYKSFGASGNCNNCPLDAYKCQYYNEHTLMEFCERIDDAPTVDAVPLEDYKSMEQTVNKLTKAIAEAEPLKHGHWIFNPKDAIEMMFTLPKCSECGAESSDGGNYCTNCGAKMDEVET